MSIALFVTQDLPRLACATRRACAECDVFPACGGAETYLERREREENLRIKIMDKFTQ
jgi:hypothetical protein